MDLNVIKQRLENMNKQTSKSGGGEKKNLFWKPTIGKQIIRVVPNKFNKQNPFTEMMFYYGIGERVIASPANWGDPDPIMEFVQKLRQTSDKENWRLAKKLEAKVRTFAPVLVRGMEEEGVKLWQFGSMVYQEFLNMATDDEIGDFTDVSSGRDIKLTTVGPEVTGTAYNKTSLSPSLKTSPLNEDSAQVEKLLEEQADPKSVFKRFTYDEIKTALQKFIAPEDELEEGSIHSEPSERFESEPVKSNYSLNAKPKETKSDKFDSLFEEDDLPF
ncbi:hypothetical protein N9864_00085 [bacterium]|nr:hypothetical protein [bacterium]|tara:strand:- start:463 stop:1281 length:819 start_codon:yes stop_codon:yes gene_type:complete